MGKNWCQPPDNAIKQIAITRDMQLLDLKGMPLFAQNPTRKLEHLVHLNYEKLGGS